MDKRGSIIILLFGIIIGLQMYKIGEMKQEVFHQTDILDITDPETEDQMRQENINDGFMQTERIIVLDAGHGKVSSAMTSEEKEADGWIYDSSRNEWGEWRHFKFGTMWHDCEGEGCTGRVPAGASCWYKISDGDRENEPEINLQNALYAKRYLEELGYTVRMVRESNDENPSMAQRAKYCYPNLDVHSSADAAAYICIHSNSGGGSGTAFISLSGEYTQSEISSDYVNHSNLLGKYINDEIVNHTSLGLYAGGDYKELPELVLFNKCPVTIAYLEIGFFDNAHDLNILQSQSDEIGYAIAVGINKYFTETGM